MKIKNIKTIKSNVNFADEINIYNNNSNYGISHKEFDEMKDLVQNFSKEIKKELKNDYKLCLSSEKVEKEKRIEVLKSKLLDYGVSLASSLSFQGILELLKSL